MSAKFGVFVPQGWRMDLVEIRDPLAQYEAMTAVAREAEKAKFDQEKRRYFSTSILVRIKKMIF